MEENKKLARDIKILIIDDDKAVRDFLKRFLKDKGFSHIQAATTGEEGLKIISGDGIKLVLLDIRLPDINGIEVLNRIKKINKDIGVIMITGFTDEKISKEALALGASDYIMKPFDLAYLELSVFTKIISSL